MLVLFVLAAIVWGWVGFKTWAFVIADIIGVRNRLNVMLSAVGGLLWPLVYTLILVVLITGILIDSDSWVVIKDAWKRT